MPSPLNVDLDNAYPIPNLSVNALNNDFLPAMDASSFDWLTVYIGGSTYSGQLSIQGTRDPDDASSWVTLQMFWAHSLSIADIVIDSVTYASVTGPLRYPWLRIRATAWTSGQADGSVELKRGSRAMSMASAYAILLNSSVGIVDGGDVTQGLTTDSAIVSDANGTISGKLRGLVKILADVWDSTNHLLHFNLKRVGGTAVDTNSGSKSAGTQRFVLATDQPQLTNALKTDGSGVTQPVSGTIAGQGLIFKPIQAVGITAGTPALIWTPTTGKKFRLLGYHIGTSAANLDIIFEDDTGGGNEFLRIPRALTTNYSPVPCNLGTEGYLSTTVNHALYIDVTTNATIYGYVFGKEE